MKQTNNPAGRNDALDFTKGALVLFMVLYHWLNYFVSPEGDFYRYIRFVTPSFIFITGFLISHMYFTKYGIFDARLPKRLIERGFKILGVFIALNLLISFVIADSYDGQIRFGHFSIANLISIFVTGNPPATGAGKAAAFYVLVPISYVLLLSAGLLIVSRFYKYIFHALFLVSLLCIFLMNFWGFESANLKLLTIGLLGLICGYFPDDKIDKIVRHPYSLIAAYGVFTIAITVWNAIYPLQIAGVFLSVMLIYMVGARIGNFGPARTHIILLGQYSLFGYIAQIAVLQLLFRSLRHANSGNAALIFSFFAAFALTMIAVEAVNLARTRSLTVNGLYKIVFS